MPTGDTTAPPAIPTPSGPDQTDADHPMDIDQHAPAKITRTADPSRVTTYRAFSPVASFPKGSISEHCVIEACSYLVGAKPKFTKGNPKMVVIETTNQDTHTVLITTGLKAKGAHTKFLDYSPKWKNAGSGLVEIAVSGLPRGYSVDAVAAQLSAHLGKSVEESSCGAFKHRGVYRSTAFFMLKDCDEIAKVIHAGRIEVNGTHLTVRSTEHKHDYKKEKEATIGLYGLKPGMNDDSVYRSLVKYGVEGVKSVQIRRRGLQQRPIRAAVVIFQTKDDMEAATSILFGAGPLNRSVWAPLSGKACDACGVEGHRVLECTTVHYRPRRPMADAAPGRSRDMFDSQVRNGVSWSSVVGGGKAAKVLPQEKLFDEEIKSMERMCMSVAIVTGTPRDLARERFQEWETEEREKRGFRRMDKVAAAAATRDKKARNRGIAGEERGREEAGAEGEEKEGGKGEQVERDMELVEKEKDVRMEGNEEINTQHLIDELAGMRQELHRYQERTKRMERELRACQRQMAEKDKVITDMKDEFNDKHAELCERVAEAEAERDEWRSKAEQAPMEAASIEYPIADTTMDYGEAEEGYNRKGPIMTPSDDEVPAARALPKPIVPSARRSSGPVPFDTMPAPRCQPTPAKRGIEEADINAVGGDVQHSAQRPRQNVTTRSQTNAAKETRKLAGPSSANSVRNASSTTGPARRP